MKVVFLGGALTFGTPLTYRITNAALSAKSVGAKCRFTIVGEGNGVRSSKISAYHVTWAQKSTLHDGLCTPRHSILIFTFWFQLFTHSRWLLKDEQCCLMMPEEPKFFLVIAGKLTKSLRPQLRRRLGPFRQNGLSMNHSSFQSRSHRKYWELV